MIKNVVFFAGCLLLISISLQAQIKVNSSGNVGIKNTSPAYTLDVTGTTRMATGSYSILFSGTSYYPNLGSISLGTSSYYWYQFYATTAFLTNQPVIMSDAKYKSNVAGLASMKDKLKALKPVSYNIRTDVENIKTDSTVSNYQYGFIAQEFGEIFPNLVTKRDDGVLGIRYTELIPVMIQVLQEQQEEIEKLKIKIAELESKQ